MGIKCRKWKYEANGKYGKHMRNELSEIKVWSKVGGKRQAGLLEQINRFNMRRCIDEYANY